MSLMSSRADLEVPGQGLEVLPGDLDGVLEVIRSWEET